MLKKIIFLTLLFLAAIVLFIALIFKDNFAIHDSRINILLLGVAGGLHAGTQLTDTMMLMTINPGKNEVVLVSIPRDLYLTDLKGKINSAYVSGGLALTKAIVTKVTGQPVDYAIKIDFTGFKKAVDLVGGLDIEVENTFDDFGYPIESKENDLCGQKEEDVEELSTASAKLWEAFPCRYEHLHFGKGHVKMNGEIALKFVRSRDAEGQEGTDFARSRRQQKVMLAFKNKILQAGTLFNPFKMISLYNILRGSLETDIPVSTFDDFIRLSQKMKEGLIRTAVLDYGDKEKGTPGLLVNPPVSQYGAWVLIPRTGEDDFSEIQGYVKCQLESGNCPIR